MSLRKWIVRGLVFLVAGSLAAGGLLYEHCTNPVAIRHQVIDKLGEHLREHVRITLDGARLRLLGGISFSELRLSRSDDPDRTDFLYVPSGVIYHDKEQLLNGTLAIRKIVLHRPRLRVIRWGDAAHAHAKSPWNLADVLLPPEFDKPKPTIVIQQGTILVEDRPDLPPVEIRDVSLTVINDPIRTLVFQAAGMTELMGKIQASGAIQRDTDEFTGSVNALDIPIGPALVQRLTAYTPPLASESAQVQATGKLQSQLHYDPERRSWNYEAHLEVANGSLQHDLLPMPLEQLEGTVHCVDGELTVERLTAQSGPARLELTGKALALHAATDCEGILKIDHYPVTPDLFARLPEGLRDVQYDYQPSGPLSMTLELRRRDGKWRKHCTLQPEDMKATCSKFPYPLERLRGEIQYEVDAFTNVDRLSVELDGYAGPQPIHIRGKFEGEEHAQIALDIWGENVSVDETLIAALPATHQQLARSFQPSGRVDFVASIRREPGQQECANRYLVRFHDCSIRYAVFPYPLENVSGVLDILPDHWEYRDFHASHKGCEVSSHGGSRHGPEGERVTLAITGRSVLIDDELERALQPGLKKAWKLLSPTGRFDFAARIEHLLSQPEPDLDVTVTPRGCGLMPAFFPYRLDQLTGSIRYAGGVVYLSELETRHDASSLVLHKGKVQLKPGGGSFVNLADLEGKPIHPDAEFLRALPPTLRRALDHLQLRAPLALRTQLVVDLPPEDSAEPPTIYWDGGISMRNATVHAGVPLAHVTGRVFCRGTHDGQLKGVVGNLELDQVTLLKQPIRSVHSHIEVEKHAPDILLLRDLKGKLFGGDVHAEARIDFGTMPHFDLYVLASQINLEELGRHNLMSPSEISGLAAAQLYLEGKGTELATLRGRGNVDVPNGRMYNLPLLLDLLKFLGLRFPDRTAFEEAHARFSIQGSRVHISRVDLYGNAISLSGEGTMNLDGSDVNLDFYAVWARVVQLLQAPIIKEVPPLIGKNLLRIKMRGRVGDVTCTKEPLPVLLDPVRDVLNWMKHRAVSSE